MRITRRAFALAAGGSALTVALARQGLAGIPSEEAWARAADIARKVSAPRFRGRVFDITTFGARGDGKTLNTSAIAKAIAECAKSGGGRVHVPAGKFLTGAIHLKSNVELHVSEGATLLFDTNPASYPLVFTRWEGIECMNYSPLIYAASRRTSPSPARARSTARAARQHWWAWKGRGTARPLWLEGGHARPAPARQKLFDMAEAGVPVEQRVFGDGRAASAVHPALCLRERADRGHHVAQLAVLGNPSGAVQERHPARRGRSRPWSKQRRLRSGVRAITC